MQAYMMDRRKMWFDVQAALEALGDNETQRPLSANPANLEKKPK